MNKRLCNNCGRYMTRGYVIENGMEYYCSEKCLDTRYITEEYLKMYDDGNGDSYWTEWEDEIEKEVEYLKRTFTDETDYFGFIKEFKRHDLKDVTLDDVLDRTLNYCLYDGYFNPYYDKEYIDCMWVKNRDTGLIYNVDDMFDIFYEVIRDIEEYGGC